MQYALIFNTTEEMENALKKINNPHPSREQQKLPPKQKDKQVQEDLPQCSVEGCEQQVSYPTHTLCYDHWKEQQNKIEEA